MAELKFLHFDQGLEAFREHNPAADSLTLTGLTVNGQQVVTADQLYLRNQKQNCRLKTTASLSTWTQAGAGPGKTLTAPTDAASNNDFDGVAALLGDRILVTFAGVSETAGDAANGIYTVTALGDGAGVKTDSRLAVSCAISANNVTVKVVPVEIVGA